MSTSAEELAQRFHERYERLAPDYSYETREASAVPWEDVPDNNKQLMIAVCIPIAAELNRPTAAKEALLRENEALRAELDDVRKAVEYAERLTEQANDKGRW